MSEQLDLKRAVVQGLVLGVVAAGVFYLAYQAILHTLWREIDTATKGGNSVTGSDSGERLGEQFGGSGSDESGQGGAGEAG